VGANAPNTAISTASHTAKGRRSKAKRRFRNTNNSGRYGLDLDKSQADARSKAIRFFRMENLRKY
jgi:hypothetical protein